MTQDIEQKCNSPHHLDDILKLYHNAESEVERCASRIAWINYTVLTLSVLTSGALWLLVSHTAPHGTEVAGAAISTMVTFLTVFLSASGLESKRKSYLDIYKKIGDFIAYYRSTALVDDSTYWSNYKNFEYELRRIRSGPTT